MTNSQPQRALRGPSRTGISLECEREFALRIAEGHEPEEAARLAGFPSSARPNWAMRTASFAEALRRAMSDRLNLLAPGAVTVLKTLSSDPTTPARVRVDAAKALLDRSGYVAAAPTRDRDGDKRLEEMSTAELTEYIRRLELEKSDRAEDVTPVAEGENLSGIVPARAPEDFLS